MWIVWTHSSTIPLTASLCAFVPPIFSLHANSSSSDYDDTYHPIIKSFTVPDTPPERERTRPFSWAWFKSYRPPLPPRFQVPFPFNIVRIHLSVRKATHSTDPSAGFTCSPPNSLSYFYLSCAHQVFHLILSFPLAH